MALGRHLVGWDRDKSCWSFW